MKKKITEEFAIKILTKQVEGLVAHQKTTEDIFSAIYKDESNGEHYALDYTHVTGEEGQRVPRLELDAEKMTTVRPVVKVIAFEEVQGSAAKPVSYWLPKLSAASKAPAGN